MKRKIIQRSESATGNDFWESIALCNDGTVWYRKVVQTPWSRIPDIPQDQEDDSVDMGEASGMVYYPRVIDEKKMISWVEHEVRMLRAEFYLDPCGYFAITGTVDGVKWWWDKRKLELCGKRAVDCLDLRDGKYYYGDAEIPMDWIERVAE